jgi:hypothetical protein
MNHPHGGGGVFTPPVFSSNPPMMNEGIELGGNQLPPSIKPTIETSANFQVR